MAQHPTGLYLAIRRGPKAGSAYPLQGGSITIGRRADNDIAVDEPKVSRHHARLTWQGNTFLLEDLGSANGTWVNDVRITGPVLLHPGDIVGLSQEVLLVFSEQPQTDETMVDASARPPSIPAAASPSPPAARSSQRWLIFGLGGLLAIMAIVLALVVVGVAIYLLVWKPAQDPTAAETPVAAMSPSVAEGTATATVTPPPTATPKPQPTATSPGIPPVQPQPPHDVLVYSDDFSDPDSGWGTAADENGERTYENGELVIRIKQEDWTTWTWGTEDTFSDFTLEVSARLVDGPEIARYGVIFRHQDDDNYYYVYVSGEGKYRVGKQQGGEWGSVSDMNWTPSPHIQTGGATNRLKVVCFGPKFSLYVNDQHLITMQDDALDAGKIGIIAETVPGSDPIQVAFDNLKVYASEAKATATPTPAVSAQVMATVATAKASRPVFGPNSGSLPHKEDGSVEAKRAEVDLRDFVVEAVFYNPYPATKGGWDMGFMFRDGGQNDEFRLSVKSDGDWSLNDRRGDEDNFIDKGRVSNLDVSAGGSNRLALLTEGDRGFFFVNDVFIIELDLSSRTNSGDVSAAIGVVSDQEIQGEATAYQDFTVWSLTAQAQHAPRATATPEAPPVPPTKTPASPNKIAFVSDRDGNQEIYVMNADGSGVTRLTNHPAEDNSPVWSPDGTRIAFVSTRDGNSEIYVMNADGSGQTNLTNNPSPDYDPTWSPDGGRIAFTSSRDDPVKTDIWVMGADGSSQAKLRDFGVSPAWSPDGSQIAALFRFGGLIHLGVMPADGSAEPRPLLQQGMNNFPAWSPDGSRIAFESAESASASEVLVINAGGGNLANLTNHPALDLYPTWSPDGARIAFVSDRDGNDEIYVMNADGSGVIRLTNNLAWDASPSWSP